MANEINEMRARLALCLELGNGLGKKFSILFENFLSDSNPKELGKEIVESFDSFLAEISEIFGISGDELIDMVSKAMDEHKDDDFGFGGDWWKGGKNP